MKIEDILLKKEEIPILNECFFQMPIHPRLLDRSIMLDPKLANKLFPNAAQEWYIDLKEYEKTIEDESTKKWLNDVFLKEEPQIKEEYGIQYLRDGRWEDRVERADNGFARCFMINRDVGGSMFFNNDRSCEAFVSFDGTDDFLRFSKEKITEFAKEIKDYGDFKGGNLHVYGLHNVDAYPGALFLRNWAILYLNEAMKQVLK